MACRRQPALLQIDRPLFVMILEIGLARLAPNHVTVSSSSASSVKAALASPASRDGPVRHTALQLIAFKVCLCALCVVQYLAVESMTLEIRPSRYRGDTVKHSKAISDVEKKTTNISLIYGV